MNIRWLDQGRKPKTESVDFEYAKEKGLMFDPLTISKPELVAQLQTIIETIPIKEITDAFLCSLTKKRLDWRSGLASYANARCLLTEKDVPDFYFDYGEDKDLNVLNFERIKWGGVRHDNGLYNLLDLKILNNEVVPSPTEQNLKIFKSILSVIDNSETD